MLKCWLARRPQIVPVILAAIMLLLALLRWPYDYYRVLRWVTCAAAVFVAYCGWTWKQQWATWLFGVVAVLFNPLIPIHLTRDIWQVIDVVVAGMFVLVLALAAPTPEEETNGKG